MKLNFYDEAEEKQVAEVEIRVAADATYVNTSEMEVPEGYELVEVGDLPIRDGYVYVPVRKVAPLKTLRIYWAIDNPDGAEWVAYNHGEPWTQTIAWTDRENMFAIPELNVKDGYELAGWSVSGMQSAYWGAHKENFGLTGMIVEDEEGGYVAITANVVVKEEKPEPVTYTVTYTDGMNGTIFANRVFANLSVGAATPAFGSTPSRAGYVFAGWTPALADKVSANAVYTATWKTDANNNGVADDAEGRYTVTYTDGVSAYTVFKDQVYSDLLPGTATPAFVGTPTRSGYTFAGWNPGVSDTVTGNVVYTATWKQTINNSDVPKTTDNLHPVQIAFLIGSAVFLGIAAFSGAKYRMLCKHR